MLVYIFKLGMQGSLQCMHLKKNLYQEHIENSGLAQWLTPVIPALWEANVGGVQDQPGQDGKTSSLLKIQKLAGCSGMHL